MEVDINPTESEEKIKKAIWNLFGELPIITIPRPSQKGNVLTAEGKGLEVLSTLRNLLRREQIRDSSRKALCRGISGDSLVFYLNKQVAFVGRISFSEAEAESPLGPIKVTVQTNSAQEIVNWLAPKTGKP